MPEESSRGDDRDFVAGLARGLRVIECFGADAPELTLSEVAQRTSLPPATARRALLTLQTLGYVRANRRRFVLTSRVLALGAAYLASMNLRDVVQPVLQTLSETLRDAASMTVLEGNDVVYIVHAAMKRDRRYRQSVGSRLPAHATSTGHAMLAHLPAPAQAAFLAQAPFPRFTPRTPGTAEELRAILERVRAQGHASVCDVIEYGVVAVAVPVRDLHGRTIAAINCSADTTRVDEATMLATRLPHLRSAAAEIEEALARFPALAHSVG